MIVGGSTEIVAASWGLGRLGPGALTLLAIATASALIDWVAVSGRFARLEPLEYPAKPGVLAALLAMAIILPPLSGSERQWFVAALACCLAGDVCLMVPGDRTSTFGVGLGSFLAAHVLFVVGISRLHPNLPDAGWSLLVLAAAGALPAFVVLRAVASGRQRWLVGPIAVYLGALLVMAAAAWSAGMVRAPRGADPLLAAGALAFVVSDTLLALDRFVRPLPRAKLVVHVTYHLAVVMMVLSLAAG